MIAARSSLVADDSSSCLLFVRATSAPDLVGDLARREQPDLLAHRPERSFPAFGTMRERSTSASSRKSEPGRCAGPRCVRDAWAPSTRHAPVGGKPCRIPSFVGTDEVRQSQADHNAAASKKVDRNYQCEATEAILSIRN